MGDAAGCAMGSIGCCVFSFFAVLGALVVLVAFASVASVASAVDSDLADSVCAAAEENLKNGRVVRVAFQEIKVDETLVLTRAIGVDEIEVDFGAAKLGAVSEALGRCVEQGKAVQRANMLARLQMSAFVCGVAAFVCSTAFVWFVSEIFSFQQVGHSAFKQNKLTCFLLCLCFSSRDTSLRVRL